MILLTFVSTSFAQENYTIDGTSYALNKEVEGTLTLLWNTIDGQYRYFSKKGMEIRELKNTKSENGYEEEYKTVLKEQTAGANISTENLKLTLPSLKKFFNEYNSAVDSSYSYETPSIKLKTRLGAFLGGSNNIFFVNPDNTFLPSAGIEFEVIDDVKLLRHALALRLKQLFSSSKYDFSSTQLSLNYRFKFVKTEAVDIYANVKIVSYTNLKRNITVINDAGQEETLSGSGGEFQVPGAFGIGADIPLGNGFIIVSYNDIFGLNIESNDEFPVDFSLGYKFNL
jgi:hypothetical protein